MGSDIFDTGIALAENGLEWSVCVYNHLFIMGLIRLGAVVFWILRYCRVSFVGLVFVKYDTA